MSVTGSVVDRPKVTANLLNADQTIANTPHKVLLVGQITAAATVSDGSLTTELTNDTSVNDALFGQSSMLAAMVRAFKQINSETRVDAIALDDALGTPREVDIVIGGTTATAAGTYTVVAGSDTLHTYEIAVAATNTPTIVGAAIEAAINADADCPFTAANVTGTVTLTADNDGTVANTLGIGIRGFIPALTTTVSQTDAGITDPDTSTIFEIVNEERYNGVVWPYADVTGGSITDFADLTAFLNPRFNADGQVLDGVGFATTRAILADNTDAIELINSQSVVVFADKLETSSTDDFEYLGPALNEPSYSKSTYMAAVRALRLTDGTNISNFLVSNKSRDQRGGPALASLPYANTILDVLPSIPVGFGWSRTEIGQINDAGGSIMGQNRTGTTGLIGEVYTTFLTDGAGNPDITWEFLNYVDTASQAREYFFNNYKAEYAQTRLTEGDMVEERDNVNPQQVEAFTKGLANDLTQKEFVLMQAGEEARIFFDENLTVTFTLASGLIEAPMSLPIVTQAREIIAPIKIAFDTTA